MDIHGLTLVSLYMKKKKHTKNTQKNSLQPCKLTENDISTSWIYIYIFL